MDKLLTMEIKKAIAIVLSVCDQAIAKGLIAGREPARQLIEAMDTVEQNFKQDGKRLSEQPESSPGNPQ